MARMTTEAGKDKTIRTLQEQLLYFQTTLSQKDQWIAYHRSQYDKAEKERAELEASVQQLARQNALLKKQNKHFQQVAAQVQVLYQMQQQAPTSP